MKKSTELSERYTPLDIIEDVRHFAQTRSIDLDVASCAEANERVRAGRYFTQDNDALKQGWLADTIWCNPPYEGLSKHFVDKLLDDGTHFDEAFLLINGDVSTRAFQRAMRECVACVLFSPRLAFTWPGGVTKRGNSSTNAMFYFNVWGERQQAFSEAFSKYGVVVGAV